MTKEKTYTSSEIETKLNAELPGWEYRDGWIRRHYKTADWSHTMMLVGAVGYAAEAAFHHPDLSVSYAMVDVKLQTHSAKGVTDKDFELAKRIEQVATWLPPEGSPFEGFEKGFGKKWTR
jgi:4a-hydroxytetrahydrobiopterin dehydratase